MKVCRLPLHALVEDASDTDDGTPLRQTLDESLLYTDDVLEIIGDHRLSSRSWPFYHHASKRSGRASFACSMSIETTMKSFPSSGSASIFFHLRRVFLARLRCRLIMLPFGAGLQNRLSELPASIIYDKLLCGGVTRYRLLVSSSIRRHPDDSVPGPRQKRPQRRASPHG
jgi:hypothetical protein